MRRSLAHDRDVPDPRGCGDLVRADPRARSRSSRTTMPMRRLPAELLGTLEGSPSRRAPLRQPVYDPARARSARSVAPFARTATRRSSARASRLRRDVTARGEYLRQDEPRLTSRRTGDPSGRRPPASRAQAARPRRADRGLPARASVRIRQLERLERQSVRSQRRLPSVARRERRARSYVALERPPLRPSGPRKCACQTRSLVRVPPRARLARSRRPPPSSPSSRATNPRRVRPDRSQPRPSPIVSSSASSHRRAGPAPPRAHRCKRFEPRRAT